MPYERHPRVVATRLEGDQAVLLHLDAGQYFTLNDTGARIWELLPEHSTPAALAAALADEYEVEEDAAHQEAERFLHQLVAEDMAREVPG